MKTCSRHPGASLRRISGGILWAALTALMGAGCWIPAEKTGAGAAPQVRISSLTELAVDPAANAATLKALVEIFDAQGGAVQMPCVLRFELYEFRPLDSDPRGKRIMLWPQQDLTDPAKNSEHWKEYLRGYEFLLPVEAPLEPGKNYVLEATCLMGDRRFRDVFTVHMGL